MTANALSTLDLPLFYDRLEDFFRPWSSKENIFASMVQKEDGYELYLPLPGVKKENIKIDTNNNVLSITVGYLHKKDGEGESYTCPGCHKSYFNHSFDLDEKIDKDKIEMQYEDHILKLIMPFKKIQ
ncbi:MAG TPA: Hsp20/alpha crystallin family protein [Chitinophagaceae bacterium]|nr:Hsp20/alpha crystallin family protein [Chitinophagaceae bacterium]